MSDKAFEEWAVLELMGHRRLAGRVSEETIGGAAFIRIDVPGGATQFYAPGAVYCITPTSEEIARQFAEGNKPRPVERYELPAPIERQPVEDEDFFDDGAETEDEDIEP